MNPEFCTCGDRTCPNHPSNRDKGCTLCIEKNLRCGEIPSCFFHASGNPKQGTGYTYEDFAKTILNNREEA